MKTAHRIVTFIAVGCCAAAVHLAVVMALVSQAGAQPLLANVMGWMVAFAVSFLGQWRLTFRARGAPAWRALRRFMALSLGGFLVNEAAYATLLHLSPLRYDVLLGMVLVGVAVMTYLLGSRWAFRGSPAA